MPAPSKRPLFRRRDRSDDAGPDAEATAVIAVADAAPGDTEEGDPETTEAPLDRPPRLERERRDLIDRREDAVYHLGGLAYELHRRGLLLGRAMRNRADAVAEIDERVRAIDASLAEIERRREARREERRRSAAATTPAAPAASSVACAQCEAIAVADAAFCWKCGAPIATPDPDDSPAPEAQAAAPADQPESQ